METGNRKHPSRRAKSAQNRPFRGRGRRRRSGSATCGRSRTRSGTSCPGDIYTRAFIQTYAVLPRPRRRAPGRETTAGRGTALPSGRRPGSSPRSAPAASRPDRGRGGRILAVVVVAALIGAVVAIGLASGGGDSSRKSSGLRHGQGKSTPRRHLRRRRRRPASRSASKPPTKSGSACSTPPKKPVIDGQILAAGEREGPFHSERIHGRLRQRLGRDEDRRQAGRPARIAPARSVTRSTPAGRLTELQRRRKAELRMKRSVAVRAGIVVTGTEVLTGTIADAQRALGLRTAGRARGRGRPHPRRRRPARRPRGGAALHGRPRGWT